MTRYLLLTIKIFKMKKTAFFTIIISILILCFFLFEPIFIYTSGWSQIPDTSLLKPVVTHKDVTSKKADSILAVIHNRLKSPAVSIAVGQHGKIVWSNAIGYQNIEEELLADLNTKFRIGSTSKAVTSLGIGVLLKDQKINLKSTVKDFVPYANQRLSQITLHQLASHTSGIRNYGACFCFPMWEYYNNDAYESVQESVGIFNDDDLLFSPGSAFSYSSYNYTLLSAMLEGASGMDFPSLTKKYVFDPLDIKNIIPETSQTINNASKFYFVEENTYKEVFKVNNSNKWAGGGFLATPTDLVKIGNALLNHTLFDSEIVTTLTTPVTLDNGEINKQKYAMGWRNDAVDIFKNGTTINVWHHGGIANGSISLLALFPEYNLTVSMLANKNGSSADLFKNVYDMAKLFIISEKFHIIE